MTKLFRQAPFLRLCLFFILGILAAYYGNVPNAVPGVILLVSLSLVGISYIPYLYTTYRFRWLFGAGMLGLCFAFGGILTHQKMAQTDWVASGEKSAYLVELMEEPVRKPKSWRCLARLVDSDKKAMLYITADSLSDHLEAGQYLHIQTRLEEITYPYWKKKGYAAQGFVRADDWFPAEGQASSPFYNKALKIKKRINKKLREITDTQEQYVIASALMTGDTMNMDASIRQTFSATGTSHVLSVSGLHFSMLYGGLFFLFSFLRISRMLRWVRIILIVLLLWTFAFIVGLNPPVVRSVLMISLWCLGSLFLRKTFSLNTLAYAGLGMLIYNPFYLLDIGFQLSFSALAAILLFNPSISLLFKPQHPLLDYGWQLMSVSTSAQLGTLPFALYYFNQFPLLFLITNLFVVPLVGLLMFVIPAILIAQIFFPSWESVTVIMNQLLTLLLRGLQQIESIPNGLVTNLYASLADSIFLSIYLFLLLNLLRKRRIVYVYLGILVASLQVFYYFCSL